MPNPVGLIDTVDGADIDILIIKTGGSRNMRWDQGLTATDPFQSARIIPAHVRHVIFHGIFNSLRREKCLRHDKVGCEFILSFQ